MKYFLSLIFLFLGSALVFSQQDTVKVVITVIDIDKSPIEGAKVIVDELKGYIPETDKDGIAFFYAKKETTIHFYARKAGYKTPEKKLEERVTGTIGDNFEIILEIEEKRPLTPELNICDKNFTIYPITGSLYKYRKDEFYIKNYNKANWWLSTISFGSSLAFSGLQLHYSAQAKKYHQEALKYPITSTEYKDNFNLNKKFLEKKEKNLNYLIPSVALFVTFKSCFHVKRKRYCKKNTIQNFNRS